MRELIQLLEEDIEARGDGLSVDEEDRVTNRQIRKTILKLRGTFKAPMTTEDVENVESALDQTGVVWLEEDDRRLATAIEQARYRSLISPTWQMSV